MKDVYITYAKRTPIGKLGGSLAPVRIDDLLADVFSHFKSMQNFDLKLIDDVIVGCANQAGEDNRNLARMSLLLAGLPIEVPGTTINRLCGSSLDAIMGASARIQANMADAILVGGAEGMSRAPYVLSKTSKPFGRDQQLFDTSLGWRFPNKKMKELFPLYSMGETAEEVAKLFKIPRDRQDQFAYNSHMKAVAAQDKGLFEEEIIPITITSRNEDHVMTADESPRPGTSIEKLSKLRAVFASDGTVTAGNSSSLNDGACAVFLCSEDFLKKNNLTPLAKITGAGIRGVHPNTMGLGPIEATKSLCKKFNKNIQDFDLIELNEAFAAQSIACIDELGIDESKVNINGGAIALGHPLGCSGARIMTTLIHNLKRNKTAKAGLATMCIGVGQGIAVSIEKC